MFKRLLTLLSLLVLLPLIACNTTGGNPWARVQPQTATQAPWSLQTPQSPPESQNRPSPIEQAQVYEPYDYDYTPNDYGQPGYQPRSYDQEPLENTPFAVPPATSAPAAKVALLLPLSGQHEDLGQAMLQAAQLALFDMGYDAFELMPRDTRGTPEGGRQAAQSAVNDGAQLILGPLFAGSVRAAQPVARRAGVNMVAYSTDWTLAGGNTYIMGFLPFAQVQLISAYAASHGYKRIGVIAPNDPYGNTVISTYQNNAYKNGLETINVMRFPTDGSDISDLIRTFTRYDERQNMLKNASFLEGMAQEQAQELPYDAILLATGGDQARSIANLLSYYDLGPAEVKRLGTGLWDDEGLATEPALSGAWFAAPSPTLRRGFETRYRETYGSAPPRLATLAYDSTALAVVLARTGYQRGGRPSFDHASLTNPNGFAGIDGVFRFRPDGMVERGLAVLGYKHSGIVVVEDAPKTFQRWLNQ